MRKRPKYDMKIIGENLRRLRCEKGLSVEEVREYLCLGSVQAIYKYEQGKGYPQTDTMFALMDLYKASLDDIVRKHDAKPQKVIIISTKKALDVKYDDGNCSFFITTNFSDCRERLRLYSRCIYETIAG